MSSDNPQLISAPINPAYLLDDVKKYCRVTFNDDDDFINELAQSATSRIESYLGRQLIEAGYTWYRQGFVPGRDLDFYFRPYPSGSRFSGVIDLPFVPVISVDEIRYIDTAGTQQILDPSQYEVDLINGRIKPSAAACSWPQTKTDVFNAVEIDFTTGYGETYDTVPVRIRQALSMLVAQWYENRESYVPGAFSFKDMPEGFIELLSQYKIEGF